MKLVTGLLENVRDNAPIVHFITNYVTVNDCANITLACGGSPIMADELDEMEQIISKSSALVINIGTVNARTLTSMLRAGRQANKLGKPVILDPVGAGVSDFRNNAVNLLLREVNFTVIKGNISEIKYLSNGINSIQGVDASAQDLVSEKNLDETLRFTQRLSVMTGSIITITGPLDIIADSHSGYVLHNGHSMMPSITGTGCMSAAVAGCFLGADPAQPLSAMLASTASMGICGELAYDKLIAVDGGASTYRSFIIDAMSRLTDDQLAQRIRVQQIL